MAGAGWQPPSLRCGLAPSNPDHAVSNFIVLAVCLASGVLLQRSGRLPENASAAINGGVINPSLPALALAHLHNVTFEVRYVLPVLMPWVLFGLGAGVFGIVGRRLEFPREVCGALMLGVGIPLGLATVPAWSWFYGQIG
jgi:malate permease and related proteins